MAQDLVKRTRLTRAEKLELIAKSKETPALTYNELAQWAMAKFDLAARPHKSTISRVLKSRGLLEQPQPVETLSRKKVAAPSHVLLDVNVVEFIMMAEADSVSLNADMIIQYAKELADKLKIPPLSRPSIGHS